MLLEWLWGEGDRVFQWFTLTAVKIAMIKY